MVKVVEFGFYFFFSNRYVCKKNLLPLLRGFRGFVLRQGSSQKTALQVPALPEDLYQADTHLEERQSAE